MYWRSWIHRLVRNSSPNSRLRTSCIIWRRQYSFGSVKLQIPPKALQISTIKFKCCQRIWILNKDRPNPQVAMQGHVTWRILLCGASQRSSGGMYGSSRAQHDADNFEEQGKQQGNFKPFVRKWNCDLLTDTLKIPHVFKIQGKHFYRKAREVESSLVQPLQSCWSHFSSGMHDSWLWFRLFQAGRLASHPERHHSYSKEDQTPSYPVDRTCQSLRPHPHFCHR